MAAHAAMPQHPAAAAAGNELGRPRAQGQLRPNEKAEPCPGPGTTDVVADQAARATFGTCLSTVGLEKGGHVRTTCIASNARCHGRRSCGVPGCRSAPRVSAIVSGGNQKAGGTISRRDPPAGFPQRGRPGEAAWLRGTPSHEQCAGWLQGIHPLGSKPVLAVRRAVVTAHAP